MYLNRDFIKQGHVKLGIADITDVTVYMWVNRFVKDLVVNRNNIPPVDEDYRRQMFSEIVFFKNNCHTLINMEAKEMLANEVRKAFRDVTMFTTWREGIRLLKDHIKETNSIKVAYGCLYGPQFSGNWAIFAQSAFMKRNNLEWRIWDVRNKKCPNGFVSHIYTSCKGHQVKELKEVKKRSLQEDTELEQSGKKRGRYSYKIGHNADTLAADPNYLHIGEIFVKLTDLGKKGNTNPSVADFRKLLTAMKRTNITTFKRMSVVSNNHSEDGTPNNMSNAVSNKSRITRSLMNQFVYGANKKTVQHDEDEEVDEDIEYDAEDDENTTDTNSYANEYPGNFDDELDAETTSEVSGNVSEILSSSQWNCVLLSQC